MMSTWHIWFERRTLLPENVADASQMDEFGQCLKQTQVVMGALRGSGSGSREQSSGGLRLRLIRYSRSTRTRRIVQPCLAMLLQYHVITSKLFLQTLQNATFTAPIALDLLSWPG